jgi:hypothetical protein
MAVTILSNYHTAEYSHMHTIQQDRTMVTLPARSSSQSHFKHRTYNQQTISC